MIKTKILAGLAIMLLLLLVPAVAFAQGQPDRPHLIGGDTIDGADAVDGTVVTAFLDGRETTATVGANVAGIWTMTVEGPAGDTGIITFQVAGVGVAETVNWVSGASTSTVLNTGDAPPARPWIWYSSLLIAPVSPARSS